MGYWEQIGVANAEHRRRQAAKSQLRQRVERIAGGLLLAVASAFLWGLTLYPLIYQAWAFTRPIVHAILGHGQ